MVPAYMIVCQLMKPDSCVHACIYHLCIIVGASAERKPRTVRLLSKHIQSLSQESLLIDERLITLQGCIGQGYNMCICLYT